MYMMIDLLKQGILFVPEDINIIVFYVRKTYNKVFIVLHRAEK